MGTSDRQFLHESLQDAKTVKTLLTALAKGFSNKEITLGDDTDELVMTTADLMTVRIKADRQGPDCQVSLRVSWTDPTERKPETGAPRISG
ncbi:amphi-Trp domain-containing protein [Pseudooceanicola aestuarii]|uniref:amphi-Trp domain-containing protein n=1 Tax=Pseudooceanicola aestuarii TaxID=2697319 RepID=UPI0013D4034B|nr:amphi-Trp domain-containing protein [Pseudooceanicola aestuarii]